MKCRTSTWTTILPILAITFILNSACNKNIDAGSNKTYIAVTNISPDAQPFDIFFEGTQLNTSQLPYDSTTGVPGDPYLTAIAGVHNFKLSSGTQDYVDGNIAMQRNHYYSLFAYNSIANNNSTLKTLILQDARTVPTDTMSSVRFLNFTDTTFYITMTNATDTVPGLLTRNITVTTSPGSLTFTTIKSGAYEIKAVKNTTTYFNMDSITLDGAKIYTVYIQGSTLSGDTTALTKGLIRLN